MTVCTFTTQEFEAALPHHKDTGASLCQPLGLRNREFVYLMPIDAEVAVMIRSSIDASGVSAGTGEDSIRLWLVETPSLAPLGSKLQRWVTRQPGWQERLTLTLRTLWKWRTQAGDCPICHKPLLILRNRTTKEAFAQCRDLHAWLTSSGKKIHSFTLPF